MQLEVIGINDIPGGHTQTHKKWIARTVPGPVLGPVLGPGPVPDRSRDQSQDRSWQSQDRGLVQDRSSTGPRTSPRTGGLVLGPVLGLVLTGLGSRSGIESWCDRWYWVPIQCHLKPPFRTGTQDTGQGPRSSLPATKPARAVIDVLVVVEDPWIYSARESNGPSGN